MGGNLLSRGKKGAGKGSGKGGETKKVGDVFVKSKRSGELEKREFVKEAVLVIWREKRMLNATRMNPGHAAMKIKELTKNTVSGDMEMMVKQYISWWPDGQAHKKAGEMKGEVSESSKQDAAQEIGGDVHTVFALSLLWDSLDESDVEKKKRKEILELVWKGATQKQRDDWKKEWGFTANFANLETQRSQFAIKANQKLIKDTTKKTLKSHHQAKIKTGAAAPLAQELLEGEFIYIGKRPDEKVYLPCATLPGLHPDRHSGAWGMSKQGMSLAWLAQSKAREKRYTMKSHQINCAALVWRCLMAGYADAFVDFKQLGGLEKIFKPAKVIRAKISLVPSDLITVGEKLDKALRRLNSQFEAIHKRVFSSADLFKEVYGKLARREMDKATGRYANSSYLKPPNWHRLFSYKNWKPASSASGLRTRISSVDKKVKALEKVLAEMPYREEQKLAQTILDDYKKWVQLKKHTDDEARYAKISASEEDDLAKQLAEALEKLKAAENEMLEAEVAFSKAMENKKRKGFKERRLEAVAKERKKDKDKVKEEVDRIDKDRKIYQDDLHTHRAYKMIRSDQEDYTAQILQLNIEHLAAFRKKKLKALIALQKAVYDYAKGSKESNSRLPAILLLGHCVVWAAWETMSFGVCIAAIDMDVDGFKYRCAMTGGPGTGHEPELILGPPESDTEEGKVVSQAIASAVNLVSLV